MLAAFFALPLPSLLFSVGFDPMVMVISVILCLLLVTHGVPIIVREAHTNGNDAGGFLLFI